MADDIETIVESDAESEMAMSEPATLSSASASGSRTLAEEQPEAMVRVQGSDEVAWAGLSAGCRALWLGPDEWLIVAESVSPAELTLDLRRLSAADALIADASHGWRRLRLEGTGAPDLLASGIALDLAPSAWPLGRSAPTAYREIPVLLHAAAPERFDLYVPRSYARCLWDWLTDAAAGPGIEETHG